MVLTCVTHLPQMSSGLLQVKDTIRRTANQACAALRQDCRKYKIQVLTQAYRQTDTKGVATLLAVCWLLVKLRDVKANAEAFLVENQDDVARYAKVMGAMVLSVYHGFARDELRQPWCKAMTEEGLAVNAWLDTVFASGSGPPRPAADGSIPGMIYFESLM